MYQSTTLLGDFQDSGYTIVRDFLEPERMLDVSVIYDEVVKSSVSNDGISLETVRCSALHWIRNPSLVFGDRIKDHAITRAAGDLASRLFDVASEKVTLSPRVFLKPAGAEETKWHQEAAYFSDPSVKRLNIWIPLDDATEHSGCMKFVPDSHHQGLLNHIVDQSDPTGKTIFIPDMHEPYAVVPMFPGQASAHGSLTIHGAMRNTSNKNRRTLVMVCSTDS